MVDDAALTMDLTCENVSAEAYMERYADSFYEWVQGELIALSPVTLIHNDLQRYITRLLEVYLEMNPIGRVVFAPFVMRLPAPHGDEQSIFREPDIQVILGENQTRLTDTYMDGAADICIEIVSAESIARDYGIKFAEYQARGVAEYWIVDPLRLDVRWYRLNEEGVYMPYYPDGDGHYGTPQLPHFRLHVATFWERPLPTTEAILQAVKAMLNA